MRSSSTRRAAVISGRSVSKNLSPTSSTCRTKSSPASPANWGRSWRPTKPGAPNPDSMDLYFQGMAWFNKGRNPENVAQARAFFERALALDPGNLDALLAAAFGDVQVAINYATDDRAALLAAAEAKVTKALSQSPNNAWAHYLMGRVKLHTNREAEAIAEFERALALNPSLAA